MVNNVPRISSFNTFLIFDPITNVRYVSRTVVQAVSHRLPTAAVQVPGKVRLCEICSGHSGTQVFFEYLGFSCQSFHQLFHIIIMHNPGLAQYDKEWPVCRVDAIPSDSKKLKKVSNMLNLRVSKQ
jgi:hypothetical protein